jgi:LAO/AO transport system kinase
MSDGPTARHRTAARDGQKPDAIIALAERFVARESAALARCISIVERHDPAAGRLLGEINARTPGRCASVGVTGAPGAGKSTLTDALTGFARAAGRTVGILAVDPSSPFSGGALLGDRLRMEQHILDPGVFVRSMSARGHVGGLAPTATQVAWLLGAFGFDEVLIETVGAGQSELDIRHLVDTTVVVVTPGTGDEIQIDKAGIMEIADVFVVNKADLPGADQLVRQLRTMLNLGAGSDWRPPIVATVATQPGEGIALVWEAIAAHRSHLSTSTDADESAAARSRRSAAALVASRAREWALEQLGSGSGYDDELRAGISISVADELCARLGLDRVT